MPWPCLPTSPSRRATAWWRYYNEILMSLIPSPVKTGEKYAWYKDLSRYHWFVVIVASVGWMFDTMDQQLFNLARKPALADLMAGKATSAEVDYQAGISTAIFMVGWALGGLFFGVLGDRLGRVRTMTFTILCYSMFTLANMFSSSVWDF